MRTIETPDAPTHRGPVPQAVEVAAFGRPWEGARFMIEVTARIGDPNGGTT